MLTVARRSTLAIACASLAALAAPALPAGTVGAAAQVSRTSALGELSTSFEQLASQVSPAVVQIFASGLAIRRGGQSSGQGVVARQSASGSGVIVDASGYIVTNAHVIAGATQVRVSLPERVPSSGESIVEGCGPLVTAELVGVDSESDLAILRIESPVPLPFVPFGDSDALEQGELVFAFGSPLGLQNSVTMGVVSSVARQLEPEGSMIYIQTDAAVNPGNSGGPLVNTDGDLVGINTLIFSRSGGSDGLSFAAPSNIVRHVYEQIRDEGRVRRGAIGARAQTITPGIAAGLGLSRPWGVILSDVIPGLPAANAGLRIGDVVLRLDGKLMENGRQFDVNLYRYRPGSRVTLEVQREGEALTFQVEVVERPEFDDPLAGALASGRNLIGELGIFAVDLGRVFQYLPGPRSRRGVVVAALFDQLGSDQAFETGDIIYSINGGPIGNTAELRLALASYRRGDTVVFHVQRDGELLFLPVDVSW